MISFGTERTGDVTKELNFQLHGYLLLLFEHVKHVTPHQILYIECYTKVIVIGALCALAHTSSEDWVKQARNQLFTQNALDRLPDRGIIHSAHNKCYVAVMGHVM